MYLTYHLVVILNHLQDLDDTGLLEGFQGLLDKPSVAENALSRLNKVLDNKYSASKGIQVQELLTWNIWPDIIKIFSKGFKYVLCTGCRKVNVL